MFKTHYNDRDFESRLQAMFEIDPIQKSIERLKIAIKPRLGQNILPRWRRKKLRDNPFDSEGKLCEK